jgi:hypothetical protein
MDDGTARDVRAGDGVFTMTDEPYHPPEFDLGSFGSVTVDILFEDAGGTGFHFRAECGLVEGESAAVRELSDDAFLADHVVNLVDDGTLFVLRHPFHDLNEIGKRFYQYFPDDYDFLVVRSSLPLSNNLHGRSINVRNDITGIGLRQFDDSEEFGSAGRLQSAIFINFSLQGPLVHEIAHNWANFLSLFSGRLFGGHWGYSDVQGVLGGHATSVIDLGGGEYAVPGNSTSSSWAGSYSMIELYLMGLVPATEVPSHQVLVRPRSFRFEDEGQTRIVAAERLDTVTIADVIDSQGPRLPSYEDAQRSFRMATVVVSDRPLSPLELTYHERQAEWFGSDHDSGNAFAAATGYRATMDTRLVPSITAVLDEDLALTAEGLPESPELEQNYPNPFNGSTRWRYALNSTAVAALDIYAANGQRVKTIAQGRREAGHYMIDWDGTDDDGHSLATGVYIARLAAGDAVVTRKLMLVR